MEKTRWGILGTGRIANEFAEGLSAVESAELVAVGSRSQTSADRFGDKWQVARCHPCYDALAMDEDVDIIYISTPHTFHRDNAMCCLKAGRNVLCEKPFSINAEESAELINFARASDLFIMEAMWTRYLPLYVKLREILAEGRIGDPRLMHATFGFHRTFDPQDRLFNPELGGGALLDIGVYVVSLASMVFGEAETVGGHAHLGRSGVDESNAIILGYPDGEIASLTSTITGNTAQDASIIGTKGTIHIDGPFWRGSAMRIRMNDREEEELIECPQVGNGYNYEAVEAGECLRLGKLESDIMPLDETFSIMETLDELRSLWGLRYPGEG